MPTPTQYASRHVPFSGNASVGSPQAGSASRHVPFDRAVSDMFQPFDWGLPPVSQPRVHGHASGLPPMSAQPRAPAEVRWASARPAPAGMPPPPVSLPRYTDEARQRRPSWFAAPQMPPLPPVLHLHQATLPYRPRVAEVDVRIEVPAAGAALVALGVLLALGTLGGLAAGMVLAAEAWVLLMVAGILVIAGLRPVETSHPRET